MHNFHTIEWAARQARLLVRREWRRATAFLLTMVFTFTMTGLDTILSYAYDDYRQYNENKLEIRRHSLMTGANPLDNASPSDFVEIANPEKADNLAPTTLSDTSLNVLKSEYGDLLDTVSLQTLSERAAGGMNMDMLVNEMIVPQGQVETQTPSQQEAFVPQVDPATMADIVTMQQGPLGMSLEMESSAPDQIKANDNPDLARLPLPAAMMREERTALPMATEALPGQEKGAMAESQRSQEPQTAGIPGNKDQLPGTETQSGQTRTENQQPRDQNQVQLPETRQPEKQGETLPKNQQQPEQNLNASHKGNLSQQFMALLGLKETPREDSQIVTTMAPRGETADKGKPINARNVEKTAAPAEQGDRLQVSKATNENQTQLKDGEDNEQRSEEPEQPQTGERSARSPEQNPDQNKSGKKGEKGEGQAQTGQSQNWTSLVKVFLGMDSAPQGRDKTVAVESGSAKSDKGSEKPVSVERTAGDSPKDLTQGTEKTTGRKNETVKVTEEGRQDKVLDKGKKTADAGMDEKKTEKKAENEADGKGKKKDEKQRPEDTDQGSPDGPVVQGPSQKQDIEKPVEIKVEMNKETEKQADKTGLNQDVMAMLKTFFGVAAPATDQRKSGGGENASAKNVALPDKSTGNLNQPVEVKIAKDASAEQSGKAGNKNELPPAPDVRQAGSEKGGKSAGEEVASSPKTIIPGVTIQEQTKQNIGSGNSSQRGSNVIQNWTAQLRAFLGINPAETRAQSGATGADRAPTTTQLTKSINNAVRPSGETPLGGAGNRLGYTKNNTVK